MRVASRSGDQASLTGFSGHEAWFTTESSLMKGSAA